MHGRTGKRSSVIAVVLAGCVCALASCHERGLAIPDRSHLPRFPAEQATIHIRGRVVWKGASLPRHRPLPITVPGVPEVRNPKWEVDEKTRGVPNALVEVLGIEGRWRFDAPSGDRGTVGKEPALLRQEGYRYLPWTLGLQVGHELEVRNADDVLHNLKWTGRKNGNANQNLRQGQSERIRFGRAETIRFQCDVHNWMDAWVYVREHPIFTITKADGSFELPLLPPGTYELRALHPNPSWEGEARRVEIRDGADSQVELVMGDAS